jgi:hypothetical protein
MAKALAWRMSYFLEWKKAAAIFSSCQHLLTFPGAFAIVPP